MLQTFTPIEYLMIDVAGSFGLDKRTWQERIDWTKTKEEHILKIATTADPKTHPLVQKAKEPPLFYAGCLAYREALEGRPTGHMISLDATASGAQILSLLVNCRKSASLCNVIDTGEREDFYTRIYEAVIAAIGGRKTIPHDQVKRAVMTSLYGSTRQPREVFGEGQLLRTFYRVLAEEAPGASELNEALLALWDDEALEHSWVMPDNFHVVVRSHGPVNYPFTWVTGLKEATRDEQRPVEQGRGIPANVVHSIDGFIVREMGRRCSYDPMAIIHLKRVLEGKEGPLGRVRDRPKDQLLTTIWNHYLDTGFLSALVLDLIDRQNAGDIDPKVVLHLIDTMPAFSFQVLSVHDCFRVHPNYGNDLRRQYNQILSELANSLLLEGIVSQIVGRKIEAKRMGSIGAEVLEANYALS